VVRDLVTRARNDDQEAWDALVERYAPLIWGICRRHRLGAADAEDVSQSVWLHLADQLDRIREPAALPGWLATTTRRECLRVLAAARAHQAARHVIDPQAIADERAWTAGHELLAAERHAALREAFRDLPPCGQRLLLLLIQDPPAPYAEISARLGIPIGSIGPTRRRCLDKLRRHPSIAALIDIDSEAAGDSRGRARRKHPNTGATHCLAPDTGPETDHIVLSIDCQRNPARCIAKDLRSTLRATPRDSQAQCLTEDPAGITRPGLKPGLTGPWIGSCPLSRRTPGVPVYHSSRNAHCVIRPDSASRPVTRSCRCR